MAVEVSRALAAFVAQMGLGQAAARQLAEEYSDAMSVAELPEWLTESLASAD